MRSRAWFRTLCPCGFMRFGGAAAMEIGMSVSIRPAPGVRYCERFSDDEGTVKNLPFESDSEEFRRDETKSGINPISIDPQCGSCAGEGRETGRDLPTLGGASRAFGLPRQPTHFCGQKHAPTSVGSAAAISSKIYAAEQMMCYRGNDNILLTLRRAYDFPHRILIWCCAAERSPRKRF